MFTVLIADDDTVLCRNIALALETEGYRTRTAATAAEAAVSAAGSDLILLDVMLPDGTGFDCCKQLRAVTDAPILFLTSCSDELEIVRGLDAGADDYITKPFRLQELLSRIRANLRALGTPAEIGTDAGKQLLQTKGFGDIVVGAGIQSAHDFQFIAA